MYAEAKEVKKFRNRNAFKVPVSDEVMQGSILQSSVSAENFFSVKFLSQNFEHIPPPKKPTVIYSSDYY
jgi:hypothetical protein